MIRTSAGRMVVTAIVLCALPYIAFAQEADLRATIRAEILKDPRSAQMSEAELEGLVALLAEGAREEGVTSEDITWRVQEEVALASAEGEATAVCDGLPQFFCTVQRAFGFDGSNTIIPIGLLVTSGLLWFLLHELRHHHRLGFK